MTILKMGIKIWLGTKGTQEDKRIQGTDYEAPGVQ